MRRSGRRPHTPFDTAFVHLINLHHHHPQDPHHDTRRHDDPKEAEGIRLGDSRPPVAPSRRVLRKPLHTRKRFRNNDQTLVRAAYHGRIDEITRLFAKSTLKQKKFARKDRHAFRHGYGAHRNSTYVELRQRARALQKSSIDANSIDISTGMSALSWASKRGHDETVRCLLIDYGASVDKHDMTVLKRTPLHHAALAGHLKIVRMLIDHDAPIDATDTRGDTALILASQQGNTRTALALLEAGADPGIANKQMNDAMVIARRLHQDTIVELLSKYMNKTPSNILDGNNPHKHFLHKQLKTSPVKALLDYHLERECEEQRKRCVEKKKRSHIHSKRPRDPIGGSSFVVGNPTGFRRSPTIAEEHLHHMRDKLDIMGKFDRIDLMTQMDHAEYWDTVWGRREGETNSERLERLGEREGKIPGQCPHLHCGKMCYSMRELGVCEYLHIPERPNVPKSKTHQ